MRPFLTFSYIWTLSSFENVDRAPSLLGSSLIGSGMACGGGGEKMENEASGSINTSPAPFIYVRCYCD